MTEKGFLKHLSECHANKTWTPEPKPEKQLFSNCPDCGNPIWKMSSYWEMTDSFVCIDCYRPYYEKGQGFHSCAGLNLSELSLEL